MFIQGLALLFRGKIIAERKGWPELGESIRF